MKKETENYIMQLEKRIVYLEGRVSLLEAQLSTMKPMPTYPSPSWIPTAESDAKPKWPGLSTTMEAKLESHLEPHLQIHDIPLSIDGSTTSYSWDPISQGDKKI